MTDVDMGQLALACELLETKPLAMRLCDALGLPIETALSLLPQKAKDKINSITQDCLRKAQNVALQTLGDKPRRKASDIFHKGCVTAGGFVGGLGGLAGLAVEAPISTVVMLRSIADIARSQGALLDDPEVRLECLKVFALSGGTRLDGAVPGYYAIRTLLSQNLPEIAALLAVRGISDEAGTLLGRFTATIAERFSLRLSEKFAAQSVPLLGAVGGATVNYIFIGHFQDVARGHFIVRRLEALYGEEPVRRAYQRIRQGSCSTEETN